jgi:fructose-1,6-bisphosphatase/inositol monophosphatase family enzyme
MTTDDVEVSVIESFFTRETYIAIKGKGVKLNSKLVSPSNPIDISKSIISYDTKRPFTDGFGESSLRTLAAVHDMRRTASNLLDLCWTACGALDGMADLRGLLPIVHVCGTHVVFEAGGFVLEEGGERFSLPIEPDVRMSFVAANNEKLARDILNAFKG